MMMFSRKIKGVTLLEVMLVLAIASSLLVMMLNYTTQKSDELRRDKTVVQMQQILNAALSFYVNNSYWPTAGASASDMRCSAPLQPRWSSLEDLRSYLPPGLVNSPYGNMYFVSCDKNSGTFTVATLINTAANAAVVAGRLPLAFRSTNSFGRYPMASCTTGATCSVVLASVNVPGQNLNNARSVNFASVYYSGSCVPAPTCPPNMKPEIMVMPAAVSGVNNPPTCTQVPRCIARRSDGSCIYQNVTVCNGEAYSVKSFTAFAVGGDDNGNPAPPDKPYGCRLAGFAQACETKDASGNVTPIASDGTLYWRVCLSVFTERGEVKPADTAVDQGKMMGSLVAITRCVPNGGDEQPSGSIDVWQR
ncbi:MAG TPA: type II secretion system protein [Gammaproteobacteria bacterium]|nr:type II secretion system protein [Gammaproteobacteria bacterium]